MFPNADYDLNLIHDVNEPNQLELISRGLEALPINL